MLKTLIFLLVMVLTQVSLEAGERVVPEIPANSLLNEVTSFSCDEENVIIVFEYTFPADVDTVALELYTNTNLETPFALGLIALDPPSPTFYVEEQGELATYKGEEVFLEEYPEGFCDFVLEANEEI